jgi:MscS family membrane protein
VNDPRFATPPEAPVFVRIDTFNASSIDFLVYAFTRTTNWGEWLQIKEELAFAIMQIIERSGTAFAFPSQTIYMQQVDPPEIMAPPPRSDLARAAREELETAGTTKGFGETENAS